MAYYTLDIPHICFPYFYDCWNDCICEKLLPSHKLYMQMPLYGEFDYYFEKVWIDLSYATISTFNGKPLCELHAHS